MKYGEKYKTAEERIEAHKEWCKIHRFNGRNGVCPYKNCMVCGFSWLGLDDKEKNPLPCPFCNNEYVEVGKGAAGMRVVECICGYCSQAKESEHEAIAAHNRVCKAVAAMNCNVKIGDTIAYRALEDNGPEWKSFTVRLINDGMLYEHEDKSGDNIAIDCAHKVIVREIEVKDAEIAQLKACRDGECERIRLGAEPCEGCHVQLANDEIASLRALVKELADALWEENGPSYQKLIAKAREVCNV